MCVNIEWGCFGDDDALNDILTPYDQRVDQESSNPGKRRCSHPPARAGSLGLPVLPGAHQAPPTGARVPLQCSWVLSKGRRVPGGMIDPCLVCTQV